MTNHHHHDHENGKELKFEEKLEALFKHWIDHNKSHRDNFLSWAHKAKHENLIKIATSLEHAGDLSDKITANLEQALKDLKQ